MQVECKYDEMVPVQDLKPNPLNPNTHDDEQIQLYADILTFQGIRKPIVVSNQTGFMVVGHGALMAAKRNSWHKYPVEYQDFESPDHEYMHMVADNELGRKSRTDYAKVNAVVPELGPDAELKYLALESFSIDPAEKSGNGSGTKNKPSNPGKGVGTEMISMECSSEQADIIRQAMRKCSEIHPDFQSKGSALTMICRHYLEQVKNL
jgi:hypothetical protein